MDTMLLGLSNIDIIIFITSVKSLNYIKFLIEVIPHRDRHQLATDVERGDFSHPLSPLLYLHIKRIEIQQGCGLCWSKGKSTLLKM